MSERLDAIVERGIRNVCRLLNESPTRFSAETAKRLRPAAPHFPVTQLELIRALAEFDETYDMASGASSASWKAIVEYDAIKMLQETMPKGHPASLMKSDQLLMLYLFHVIESERLHSLAREGIETLPAAIDADAESRKRARGALLAQGPQRQASLAVRAAVGVDPAYFALAPDLGTVKVLIALGAKIEGISSADAGAFADYLARPFHYLKLASDVVASLRALDRRVMARRKKASELAGLLRKGEECLAAHPGGIPERVARWGALEELETRLRGYCGKTKGIYPESLPAADALLMRVGQEKSAEQLGLCESLRAQSVQTMAQLHGLRYAVNSIYCEEREDPYNEAHGPSLSTIMQELDMLAQSLQSYGDGPKRLRGLAGTAAEGLFEAATKGIADTKAAVERKVTLHTRLAKASGQIATRNGEIETVKGLAYTIQEKLAQTPPSPELAEALMSLEEAIRQAEDFGLRPSERARLESQSAALAQTKAEALEAIGAAKWALSEMVRSTLAGQEVELEAFGGACQTMEEKTRMLALEHRIAEGKATAVSLHRVDLRDVAGAMLANARTFIDKYDVLLAGRLARLKGIDGDLAAIEEQLGAMPVYWAARRLDLFQKARTLIGPCLPWKGDAPLAAALAPLEKRLEGVAASNEKSRKSFESAVGKAYARLDVALEIPIATGQQLKRAKEACDALFSLSQEALDGAGRTPFLAEMGSRTVRYRTALAIAEHGYAAILRRREESLMGLKEVEERIDAAMKRPEGPGTLEELAEQLSHVAASKSAAEELREDDATRARAVRLCASFSVMDESLRRILQDGMIGRLKQAAESVFSVDLVRYEAMRQVREVMSQLDGLRKYLPHDKEPGQPNSLLAAYEEKIRQGDAAYRGQLGLRRQAASAALGEFARVDLAKRPREQLGALRRAFAALKSYRLSLELTRGDPELADLPACRQDFQSGASEFHEAAQRVRERNEQACESWSRKLERVIEQREEEEGRPWHSYFSKRKNVRRLERDMHFQKSQKTLWSTFAAEAEGICHESARLAYDAYCILAPLVAEIRDAANVRRYRVVVDTSEVIKALIGAPFEGNASALQTYLVPYLTRIGRLEEAAALSRQPSVQYALDKPLPGRIGGALARTGGENLLVIQTQLEPIESQQRNDPKGLGARRDSSAKIIPFPRQAEGH